jgi:hypothetical protein
MKSLNRTGRIIGLLVLIHLVTGLVPPYIMLRPLTRPLSFNANTTANEEAQRTNAYQPSVSKCACRSRYH